MNRSLAAKALKAKRQNQAYAQARSLASATEPHLSKDMARWLIENAPTSDSEDASYVKRTRRSVKRRGPWEPASLKDFLVRENQHNALTAPLRKKPRRPLRLFQSNPKFREIDEDGTEHRPLNASTGSAPDWARRNGVVPDVGYAHILAYKDVQWELSKKQARLALNDERQER